MSVQPTPLISCPGCKDTFDKEYRLLDHLERAPTHDAEGLWAAELAARTSSRKPEPREGVTWTDMVEGLAEKVRRLNHARHIYNGPRFRTAREAAALSQGDMGKLLHVTNSTISHWEKGAVPEEALLLKVVEFIEAIEKAVTESSTEAGR